MHTVRAYRDALKLFYLFLADQKHKPVADLALEDIQSDSRACVFGSCRIETRKLCCYPELPTRGRSQFCAASPATGRHAGGPVRSHSCHSQQESSTPDRHLSGT